MLKLSLWKKPNGGEITINNEKETIAYAKKLKWVKVKADKPDNKPTEIIQDQLLDNTND